MGLNGGGMKSRDFYSPGHNPNPSACNYPPRAVGDMYIEPGYEEREEATSPTTSLPMSHTEVMPTLSIPEKILARFTVYEELTVANKREQFEAVFRRLQNEWTVICGLVRGPSHVLPLQLTYSIVSGCCCVNASSSQLLNAY